MSGFDPERFSDQDSPLHCWDTRIKLISIFVLIISVVIAEKISQALAGLAVSVLLVLISGLPPRHVLSFIKWPFVFLLPLLVILPLTAEGEILFDFRSLNISLQGLHLGLLFIVRGTAAALLALIMMGTAPFNVNINALRSLGLPGPLTQIFLFTYRYLFLIYEELQTMRRSLDSKGFEIRSNARSARILATAIAMLLIRGYERSEYVFNAMLSRGYQGSLPSIQRQKIGPSDIIKATLICGAAVFIQLI